MLLTLCFCVQGQYVVAGCAEGALHVWTWEASTEICHIAAHKQRIHHCSLLPNTSKQVHTHIHSLYLSLPLYFILNSIMSPFLIFIVFCVFVFKMRTKKSTPKTWLFSLRLMMAQCSCGNRYRSVGRNKELSPIYFNISVVLKEIVLTYFEETTSGQNWVLRG